MAPPSEPSEPIGEKSGPDQPGQEQEAYETQVLARRAAKQG